MGVGNYMICMVSDLLEEKVVEICSTTRYILLTLPNCTLKMVKLIKFRLYVFYHNKKYTCIYKDQVELIQKKISSSFFLSSHLLRRRSHSFLSFFKVWFTYSKVSLFSTQFYKFWQTHTVVIPSPQSRNETVPSSPETSPLSPQGSGDFWSGLFVVPIGLPFLVSFT